MPINDITGNFELAKGVDAETMLQDMAEYFKQNPNADMQATLQMVVSENVMVRDLLINDVEATKLFDSMRTAEGLGGALAISVSSAFKSTADQIVHSRQGQNFIKAVTSSDDNKPIGSMVLETGISISLGAQLSLSASRIQEGLVALHKSGGINVQTIEAGKNNNVVLTPGINILVAGAGVVFADMVQSLGEHQEQFEGMVQGSTVDLGGIDGVGFPLLIGAPASVMTADPFMFMYDPSAFGSIGEFGFIGVSAAGFILGGNLFGNHVAPEMMTLEPASYIDGYDPYLNPYAAADSYDPFDYFDDPPAATETAAAAATPAAAAATNDTIIGTDGDDTISPGAGNDTITGGLGHDTINLDDAGDTVNFKDTVIFDIDIFTAAGTNYDTINDLDKTVNTALDGDVILFNFAASDIGLAAANFHIFDGVTYLKSGAGSFTTTDAGGIPINSEDGSLIFDTTDKKLYWNNTLGGSDAQLIAEFGDGDVPETTTIDSESVVDILTFDTDLNS